MMQAAVDESTCAEAADHGAAEPHENDTMSPDDYAHHFGPILSDEEFERHVQSALRRSREEPQADGRDPASASSSGLAGASSHGSISAVPLPVGRDGEGDNSSETDGEFDKRGWRVCLRMCIRSYIMLLFLEASGRICRFAIFRGFRGLP
ncbi:unnamed protein product, partial [Prorocentrum cordatum]